MEMTIIACEETEDGGMTMNVKCDEEFTREAIQHYVLYMIKCAMDPDNKEWDLKTLDADDAEKDSEPNDN